jgi:hypothetical protein
MAAVRQGLVDESEGKGVPVKSLKRRNAGH